MVSRRSGDGKRTTQLRDGLKCIAKLRDVVGHSMTAGLSVPQSNGPFTALVPEGRLVTLRWPVEGVISSVRRQRLCPYAAYNEVGSEVIPFPHVWPQQPVPSAITSSCQPTMEVAS